MSAVDVQSIGRPAFCGVLLRVSACDTASDTARAGGIAWTGASLEMDEGAGGVAIFEKPDSTDAFQKNALRDKWFLTGTTRFAAGFRAFPSSVAPVLLSPREKGAAGHSLMDGGASDRAFTRQPGRIADSLWRECPPQGGNRPVHHLFLLGQRVGIAAVRSQTLVSLNSRAVTAKKAAPQRFYERTTL